MATFKHMLQTKAKEDHPKGLLQLLSYLETLNEAFTELHRIVLIACTLPVSLVECERNFSSMKLIKNELHSVMKQERFDSLMMLGIHHERRDKLDLDTAVDRFKARSLLQVAHVHLLTMLNTLSSQSSCLVNRCYIVLKALL